MAKYMVTLTRSFAVTIDADNPEAARELAGLYVGYGDDSTTDDRQQFSFEIKELEMTMNEAVDVDEIAVGE